ncbi:WapI family immunity protein [Breznakia pachnodae]|uniref:Uncharacterized protein n=1 Tax=Breznakia pachnodae TaxID=265178 RepID=A0ABU0E6D2_9FIRM|nr:hypothetical protein [Breznakia pachnodae]MDQ0362458.1 hypothetical protein [Breznakia pachnodae]
MTKDKKLILKGYNALIQFDITKVFTDTNTWDGGFGFQGVLYIECNGFKLKDDSFHSTSEATRKFLEELQNIYNNLKGEANYRSDYEDNLNLNIKMGQCGHVMIAVDYRDYSLENIKISFQTDTDQTYLLETITNLKEIEVYFKSLNTSLS